MESNSKSVSEKPLEKSSNTWRLKHTLLNNTLVKGVSRESFKSFELNENAACQNVWDSMQEVLTGGFITLNVYMRKGEISKVDKLLPEETREKSKL